MCSNVSGTGIDMLSQSASSKGGTLVLLCINGGMISSVDAGEMQNIVKDAQKLGAESGIAVRVQLRAMNYCDFLAEYDTPPPPVRPGNFILAARELNLGALHALLSAGADPHALTRAGAYVCMGHIRLFLPRF